MSSWIDYEGEAHKDEPPSNWGHKELRNYFCDKYKARYKCYPKWAIKDNTLMSKLRKRYTAEKLVVMMDKFFLNGQGEFGMFYMAADEVWRRISEEEKGYSWN